MNRNMNTLPIVRLLQSQPQAAAVMNGSNAYTDIQGLVRFYQTKNGTLVFAEITGLPRAENGCGQRIFGFHIHSGASCTGNTNDPFADAMAHYSPNNCEHPHHAGDLPPLFGYNGKALSIFLTSSFGINEVIGRAVIIHDSPDDFTTQPSGNAGNKIACGIIRPVMRR